MKVNQVPFTVRRDGKTIRGIAFRRDESVCRRLIPVIICHGFTSDQSKTKPYALRLAEEGYASFTFDFIGGGFKTVSDGEMTDMTVLTEVEDLKAVIGAVSGRPALDMDRLVLMGCSQGGFVSGLTAAALPEKTDRLIMMYPALCIPDDARRGSMQILRFDPDNIPEFLEAGNLKLSGEYAKCMLDVDAVNEVTKYDGKVLIVHGDADAVVPYHYAEDAFAAYCKRRGGEKDVKLVRIPGAPHGFTGDDFEKACEAVLSFLREDV